MPDQKIDPLTIPCKDLPIIVLVDDRRSFIGWAIKNHSKGCYNHVMIMHKPGVVASMDFSGFHERPISDYFQRNLSLKFWKKETATKNQNARLILETMKMLPPKHENKFKKFLRKFSYDFVGIIGQRLNIRWLQLPWKWYCSEITMSLMKKANFFSDPIANTKSPADLNELFKIHLGWQVYGRWWSEDD